MPVRSSAKNASSRDNNIFAAAVEFGFRGMPTAGRIGLIAAGAAIAGLLTGCDLRSRSDTLDAAFLADRHRMVPLGSALPCTKSNDPAADGSVERLPDHLFVDGRANDG